MTVREARIAVQRPFVGFHRLAPATQVFQQNAEVVEQQGIAAAGRDCLAIDAFRIGEAAGFVDRKSTRLNSSHLVISYAVFCLKKKTTEPALRLTDVSRAKTRLCTRRT